MMLSLYVMLMCKEFLNGNEEYRYIFVNYCKKKIYNLGRCLKFCYLNNNYEFWFFFCLNVLRV